MPKYKLRRLIVGDPRSAFYITWSENRRSKRVSTGTTDVVEAQEVFAHWVLTDSKNPVANATATVGQLWSLYRAKHDVASPEGLDWSWRNLRPHFGSLLLSEVTFDKVQEYKKLRTSGGIGRPSKMTSIRRELILLQACFNWCAHPRRQIILPAERPSFELPPPGEPKDRWLRPEELQKLLNAAAVMRRGSRLSRAERFLWLALETAARKTAILELTWDRVDFETGVIHFNVPGQRKTKKRRTSVPISKALRPVLERAYAERLDPERTDGHVLDTTGEVFSLVVAVAKRAGVSGVSPHVLRHTSATLMARRGVSLWKISGVLGNSMAMVEKVYAKHAPEGLAEAVEMISGGMLEAAE